MERVIGIDLSTRGFVYCIRENNKNVVGEVKFSMDDQAVHKFLQQLKPTDTVALEAGMGSFDLAGKIEPRIKELIILNPHQLALISKSKKKTDKKDATTIALIVATWTRDELNTVRLPDETLRTLRAFLQQREHFKEQRQGHLQALWNFLVDKGVHGIGKGKLKSEKNRIEAIGRLKETFRKIAENYHHQISQLDRHLSEIENEIKTLSLESSSEEERMILGSVPGVGFLTMATLIAYGGCMKDFATPEQFASYAGLTQRVSQSGLTLRQGKISKQGPSLLRSLLVEACTTMVRMKIKNPLTEKFHKQKEQKGYGKAIIAMARRLAVIIHTITVQKTFFNGVEHEWVIKKLKTSGLIKKKEEVLEKK